MRLIINIVLLLVIFGLAYLLVANIREPIQFKDFKEKRTEQVIEKLKSIRTAQEVYKSITGEFAGSFDTLEQVLRYEKIPVIKVYGDPDAPENPEVTYDTLYFSAQDSLSVLGITLDSLRYVPNSGGKVFNIAADTLTYQKTLVHVVEVGTPYKTFMGRFADPKYARYDNRYDPTARLKFGDMNAPNLSGNWE